MTRSRRILLAAGAAIAIIGASAIVQSDPIIIWNASASVPIGLYLVTPIQQLHVGDLVALAAPAPLKNWMVERGHLGPDAPLLKHVAALPPAEICRIGTTILIDGSAVTEALPRDRMGRSLPVWHGCQRLAEDEVFLLNTDAPGSLDGRYFGPLGTDIIIGRATPFWTREG
ncbi:S26 family signal peptidase [Maribius pontilimi]|uniref:S26 family signal peptidase n=1 Tax=Palleronia pontilimi TaxID=1964209 RepID=A0A934ME30_9RHOB|nr:S26 family signal peptidase [Palleronia pontilimi]